MSCFRLLAGLLVLAAVCRAVPDEKKAGGARGPVRDPHGASSLSQKRWQDAPGATSEGPGQQYLIHKVARIKFDGGSDEPFNKLKQMKTQICALVAETTTRAVPQDEQARGLCGAGGKGSAGSSMAKLMNSAKPELKRFVDTLGCENVVLRFIRSVCGPRREDQLQLDRMTQRKSDELTKATPATIVTPAPTTNLRR